MKIPKGIGAVLFNTKINVYAIRGQGLVGFWTYGTYTMSDEGMQSQVDTTPSDWKIITMGYTPPMIEPRDLADTVYISNQVFLRWTENQDERFPWIGAKDGVKLSWKDLVSMGKVEPYEL